ncbi:MAG: SHD1 domain-containing protein [Pirellulaceae bacterium]|nr:SHD1 domain-containing protein [Pirellulaceae bacterium]
METAMLFGGLTAQLRVLKYVDPIIGCVVGVILGIIGLVMVGKCVFYFFSLDRHSSTDEVAGAVFHGIGYSIFTGVCFLVSAVKYAQSQSNPDSIAFGASDYASQPRYPTPEDFEPGRTPTISPRNPRGSGFDDDRFEVRQPNRNRPFGDGEFTEPGTRRPVRPPLPSNDADSVETRLPPSRENSKPEAVLPAPAEVALPLFQYQLDQAQKSNFAGVNSGQDFRGHGPTGSVLVGLRVGTTNGRLTGFEPIYQLAEKYVTGDVCGTLGDNRELVLAKPGYVVGGALVAANEDSMALQLRFVKFAASQNKLDVFDQYDSERMGRSSGQVTELDGKGAMVVGFFGKRDDDRICGFGVAGLKPSSGQASEAAPVGATGNSLRVWFSQDRKFSVEAKLREVKNGKAVLEKTDGSVIEVDSNGLCPEDREYLKSRE